MTDGWIQIGDRGGRVRVTEAAKSQLLAVLAGAKVIAVAGANGDTFDWQVLAQSALEEAAPYLVVDDPPTTRRQDELDGEYVLSVRAQRHAAEVQAEHSLALAGLVERSLEMVALQAEVARRELARTELTPPVREEEEEEEETRYCMARLEPLQVDHRPETLTAGPTGDILCDRKTGHEQPVYDYEGGWWDHANGALGTYWKARVESTPVPVVESDQTGEK